MNFKHTLSTLFFFYRLLSLCLCAWFGLSCLFFFFPFGEPSDGVLVGHSVLRGSQKSLWRSPYLNSGHCRNKFFCSEGQDIDFKEKSGSTSIFTGNPPGHTLPSEFRFRKACFPCNKCIHYTVKSMFFLKSTLCTNSIALSTRKKVKKI